MTDTRRYRAAIAENGKDQALERLRPRLYPADTMHTLPPPEPVVDGLLFTPGESVVYGPPKIGKTFWTIDLALSVATGTRFAGRAVKRTPVIYVIAEGVGGIGNRIEAWREHHDAGPIPDAWFLTTTVNLLDPASVDALCTLSGEHHTGFVVIDTYARCTAGMEENSTRDTSAVVEHLDQIRNTTGHVHIDHHTGKDESRGMRGSTALLGAVDTTIELAGDTHALRVAVTAQKDAPVPAPWWCQLVPVGGSAVMAPLQAGDALNETDQKILDALEALPVEHRTSTRWRTQVVEVGISEATFYRRLKVLQEQGLVGGGGSRGSLYTIPTIGNQSESEPF